MDSSINHDEFVSVNNVLQEYNEMKDKIKGTKKYFRIYYTETIETYCISSKKNIVFENSSLDELTKID